MAGQTAESAARVSRKDAATARREAPRTGNGAHEDNGLRPTARRPLGIRAGGKTKAPRDAGRATTACPGPLG